MMYYELLHIQFSIRTVATGAQNVLSNKIKKKSWTKIIKEKMNNVVLIAKCINYKKHDAAIRPKTWTARPFKLYTDFILFLC